MNRKTPIRRTLPIRSPTRNDRTQTGQFALVDDDPSLLKLLGMRLTSEGFHVTTAESGQEALRLLAREQIDLVISDLRMDEMDGMALFAEIKSISRACR